MYVHSGFSASRLPRENCCIRRSVVSDVAKPTCRPKIRLVVVTQCQLQQQDGKLATTNVGMSTNIAWHEGAVSRTEKEQLLGQKGCILWFTGLSGSGKSTVACAVEQLLNERGHYTALLDGDNIRHGLCSNLGFTPDDRKENIRRIGEVAKIMAESGIVTITSFISPYRADRDSIRERLAPCDFLEIYMDVPISICEERDPKGLYKKARAGLIKNFTGIDDPYEEPLNAEVVVTPFDGDGRRLTPLEMAQSVLEYLYKHGYLSDPRLSSNAALIARGVRNGQAADLSAML